MAAHDFPPTFVLVGQRGGGKSALTHALAGHWRAHDLALYVVDPVRDFAVPPLPGARYRLPLAAVMRGDIGEGPPMWGALEQACADALARPSHRQPAVIVCDDGNTASAGAGPDDMPPAFKAVAMEGRHVNTGFCVSVRRPSEIPRWVTSEAAHRCVFAVTEPNDLDYCRRMRLDPSEVERLPRGSFFHRTTGGVWHLHTDALQPDGSLWPCLRDPP